MASFKFEAMDTTGTEVKDSVDAATEEEAQQKIRQMGYFVTKITQVATKKGKEKKKGGKKKRGFTIGASRVKPFVPSPGSSLPCKMQASPSFVLSVFSKGR